MGRMTLWPSISRAVKPLSSYCGQFLAKNAGDRTTIPKREFTSPLAQLRVGKYLPPQPLDIRSDRQLGIAWMQMPVEAQQTRKFVLANQSDVGRRHIRHSLRALLGQSRQLIGMRQDSEL